MPIGTRWVAEIERRIAWCDYLVVLLSEDSIHSEMVQGEVRRAHHRYGQVGSPGILPIRVCYQGPLGYDSTAFFTIPTALCDGSRGLRAGARGRARHRSRRRRQSRHGRRFRADRSARSWPPVARARSTCAACAGRGTTRRRSLLHPPRSRHSRRHAAANLGETLVIKGPNRWGSRVFLVPYLQGCQDPGKRSAFVDFQSFGESDLVAYPALLQRLASALLRNLKLSVAEVPAPSCRLRLHGVRGGPDPATAGGAWHLRL